MEPEMLASTPTDAHHNPFEILELPSSATAREVARQKDTLLGMLELGIERGKRYTSQLGERERTADLVRGAARELEDPRSRLLWELWLPPSTKGTQSETPPLRTALVLHHELLREIDHAIPVGADEFDALGAAWDDVFSSDEFHEGVDQRAGAMAIDGDDIVGEFGDRVRAQMLTMLESAPAMDVDELESETASDVAHRFTDRKIELLELVASRFTAPGTFEQRRQQWTGLRREYEAIVAHRGAYTRRKAFEAIAVSVGNRAAALYNQDIDHQLALMVFNWLRDEARAVGDEDRTAFHAKNARLVGDRLSRDAAAANATFAAAPARSAFSGRTLVSVVAFAALAISRAHSCADPHPRYESPDLRVDPQLLRDLQRSYALPK
jgi:hypothetical protein